MEKKRPLTIVPMVWYSDWSSEERAVEGVCGEVERAADLDWDEDGRRVGVTDEGLGGHLQWRTGRTGCLCRTRGLLARGNGGKRVVIISLNNNT
jgi:hypothetical protein